MILNIILQVGLLVGTYGDTLYRTTYDQTAMNFGELTGAKGTDCSYICASEDGKNYFAVSENKLPGAYSFDSGLDCTAYVNGVGAYPCFLTIVKGTPYVLTANYGDGNVTVLETENGVIKGIAQTIQFTGNGPVTRNDSQIHARAHQVKPVPDALGGKGKWLLCNDLGSDAIRVLKYRKNAGQPFKEIKRYKVSAPSGSGPRHMEFNEKAGLVYIITELSGEVLVYKIKGPRLKLVQTLQAEEVGAMASADIHMHPSGKWLYTSHRNGNDGLCVFDIAEDGLLTKKAYVRTGLHPRNFALSPDGKALLVACMLSNCVEVRPLDMETGLPGEPVNTIQFAEKPVCLLFL